MSSARAISCANALDGIKSPDSILRIVLTEQKRALRQIALREVKDAAAFFEPRTKFEFHVFYDFLYHYLVLPVQAQSALMQRVARKTDEP